MTQPTVPSDRLARVQAIAERFAALPDVLAIALAGSLAAAHADAQSDLDIVVYGALPPARAVRRAIAEDLADPAQAPIEIEKPYWGDEDAWIDRASGLHVDLMYQSPAWIEEQLERVLERHEARLGYTTAFWHVVRSAQPIYDPQGWLAAVQARARQPYPTPLRRAIVRLNHPVLRTITSSYRHQIELAVQRRDRVSVQHRSAALLASYFDILFAVNRVPHPGEKRLVALASRLPTLPEGMVQQVDALIVSAGDGWEHSSVLARVDALLDALDALLTAEDLLPLAP